jgi:hypothetical protein
MGWLDANEYFNLELGARDRVDDLHAASDLYAASDDAALAGAEGEGSTAEECYRKRSTPAPRYRIFAERATASAWCARAVGARSDAGACSGTKW